MAVEKKVAAIKQLESIELCSTIILTLVAIFQIEQITLRFDRIHHIRVARCTGQGNEWEQEIKGNSNNTTGKIRGPPPHSLAHFNILAQHFQLRARNYWYIKCETILKKYETRMYQMLFRRLHKCFVKPRDGSIK